MGIFKLFLNKPIIVHFIFIFVAVYGFIALKKIPVEKNPQVTLDFAIIMTTYTGASPDQIESLITIPIEDAIANIQDIKQIRSRSENGKSIIFIDFVDGVKNYDQRVIDIQTEINKLPNLPSKDEMGGPFVYKISTGDTEPVLKIMLSSEKQDEASFKNIAENLKRVITKKVKGVKNIEIGGVADYQIEVILKNSLLIQHQTTIDDIVSALSLQNFRTPGGKMSVNNQSVMVKPVGNIKSLEQIKNIVIKRESTGEKLYLKQLAIVEQRKIDGSINSYLNSSPSISFYVMKEQSANVVEISDKTKKEISSFLKFYPDISVSFEQDGGEEVSKSISILRDNALLGMVLVSILLFLFMGWRAAFLAVIGIPFAFFATFVLMYFFGYTINSLSLFAMILVSGMLVDDAIVVIENVYRFREEGYSPFDAALKGTVEIALPVISAVLTTVAAFLPLLGITGVFGKFLALLPVIVTFTLVASLLEAIIVLPVHLYEMKNLYREEKKDNNRVWQVVVNIYKKTLYFSLKLRYLFLLVIVALLVYSFFIVSQLKTVLFPATDTDELTAKIVLVENASLETTTEYVKKVEKEILKKFYPNKIKSVISVVGRVVEDNRWIVRENVAELRVKLIKEDNLLGEEIKRYMRDIIGNIPEIVEFEFFQNTGGPGQGSPIDISIAGEDMRILIEIAQKILAFLKEEKGVVDLRSSIMRTNSEIVIEPNREMINQIGVPISKISSAIRGMISGRVAGKYLDVDGKELNIWVRLDNKENYSFDDIKNIPIQKSSEGIIVLGDVSKILEVEELAKISREDRAREVRVKANIDPKITTSNEENKKISERFLDYISENYPGYVLKLKGEAEEQKQAFSDIFYAFLMAVLIIYIILGIQFDSFFQPFIVLLTVPFAFIGVAIGLHLSNLPVSFMSGISLVALVGIVVNDSIILVDFINRVKKRVTTRREALIEAGSTRLRPIILTTVTTIGGLIPMAFFLTGSNKMWSPMAITMIWGLSFSTILTLFIIPVIYAIFDDIKKIIIGFKNLIFRKN
ncbi:efflux RND transporter permease subunit [bacterium]|nr:efflux RND transporter permease subunit [bacterium]